MIENSYKDVDEEDLVTLTELESDEIINNLKDELIMENILEQIKNPLNTPNKNYLELFETRYIYLRMVYIDSTSFINKLDEVKVTMYNDIFKKITDKFFITYDDTNIDIIACATDLYDFFILNFKDNLVDFITSTITKEKKSLALELNNTDSTKKLGYIALRKILKNKDDALIISNVTTAINNIIGRDVKGIDIIKQICKLDIDEATNFRIFKYFFNDFSLNIEDNFIKIFFSSLLNKEEGYSFIINTIKSELLNIAPKV